MPVCCGRAEGTYATSSGACSRGNSARPSSYASARNCGSASMPTTTTSSSTPSRRAPTRNARHGVDRTTSRQISCDYLISANPPGRMSNLGFVAEQPPESHCRYLVTSDFTLGSSSLLRGVPTRGRGVGHRGLGVSSSLLRGVPTQTSRLPKGRTRGVLIAPTRSSNCQLVVIHRAAAGPHHSYEEFQRFAPAPGATGPGPHRSYEEFQPEDGETARDSASGPHRSYEEFQPAGLARVGDLEPCPHRSYEEFQQVVQPSGTPALGGPHRSYEEFQRPPSRTGGRLPPVLIAPRRSSNRTAETGRSGRSPGPHRSYAEFQLNDQECRAGPECPRGSCWLCHRGRQELVV